MGPAILFIHAAAVSLAATHAGIERVPQPLVVRHALVSDLVDPRAMTFAHDEIDYQRIRRAVTTRLHAGDRRVILSCSVYNGFAARLERELGLPVERSDDAGARAAVSRGTRIGVAVSYPPSFSLVEGYLQALAADDGRVLDLVPVLDENAFAFADDAERYARALIGAVTNARELDAVFLAQYSMDPHAPRVSELTNVPVVSALQATLARLASA